MPSPVSYSSRVTEVRALSSRRVVLSRRCKRYYGPPRLPSCLPWTSGFLIPGHASGAIDLAHGHVRASPCACTTFAACKSCYAGGVPGCSRIQAPDCCLRPTTPGSTHLDPYGRVFRRDLRSSLQLRSSSPRRSCSRFRRRIHFRAPLAACPGRTRRHLPSHRLVVQPFMGATL